MPNEQTRAKVRKFVETYSAKGPYALYPDEAVVAHVVDGLADNLELHGKMYCPCAPIASSIARGREMVCPCTPHHADIARQGYCDCVLFASRELVSTDRLTSGSSGKGVEAK